MIVVTRRTLNIARVSTVTFLTMTKTRPSSTTSTMPASAASAASKARAEQESWSDSEDSMGYHVSYPNTATKPFSAINPLFAEPAMTTISIGGILTKIPANIAAAEPFTVEPIMTTISIGGILARIPSNIAASKPITNDTDDTTRSAAKEEHERVKSHRRLHVQGCYSHPSSPVEAEPKPATVNKAAFPTMPITQPLIARGLWKSPDNAEVVSATQPVQQIPVKGEGFATNRPWSDEVAMVGYASAPITGRRAKPADEFGITASCYAVSPAVALACLSSDDEAVPSEATMQRYGKILHELPGEEKRKVRALIESIEELFRLNMRAEKWYLSAVSILALFWRVLKC